MYGTSCGNRGLGTGLLPETRFINRTTWSISDFQVSMLWRHLGELEIAEVQKAKTYDPFEHIDAYNYVDLVGAWQFNDQIRFSLSVNNVFGEEPPVVGNEAGSTSFNSGNTFPSFTSRSGPCTRSGSTRPSERRRSDGGLRPADSRIGYHAGSGPPLFYRAAGIACSHTMH